MIELSLEKYTDCASKLRKYASKPHFFSGATKELVSEAADFIDELSAFAEKGAEAMQLNNKLVNDVAEITKTMGSYQDKVKELVSKIVDLEVEIKDLNKENFWLSKDQEEN